MITLYAGRRGSGKTTCMVKDAYRYLLAGYRIITNMHSLTFAEDVLDNQEILELLLDDTVTDCVLVLDEIQTFIDSRRSGRKQNVTFTYFIQQIRKRNISILATTQYARRVDVAFREHVDVLALPEFKKEYPVVVVVYYDLTATQGIFSVEDGRPSERAVIFNPLDVFDLFNTTELIEPKKAELKGM